MNIRYDGKIVIFETTSKSVFEAEKTGAKSNIVRILDQDEYNQIKKADPKKIIVQHQHEIFSRIITDVFVAGNVFDKIFVVISWLNEHPEKGAPLHE